MTERTGTCTSCGQKYGNIPPTVTATRVKCRKCGGVVEIPPLPETSAGTPAPPPRMKPTVVPKPPPPRPKPAPPRPAPPKPAPPKPAPPKPAPPKPAPPRPAQAAAAVDPAKKAAAAEIIARARARREAEARRAETAPAAEAPAKKESAAEIIARARARREAEARSHEGAPVARKTAARHGRAAASHPSRRGRSAAAERRGDTHGARHRHHPPPRKKSKAPLVLLLVVILGGGGAAAWYFLGQGGEEPAEPTTTESAAAPEDTEIGTASGETGGATQATPPPAEAVSEPAPAPQPEAPKPSEEPDPGTFEPPAPGETIVFRGITAPEILDLAAVPPLAPFRGTSAEEWASIQEDVALFLEDAGASSDRAGRRLINDTPRKAFPAIVNAMMKLNWNDAADLRTASALNDLLFRVSNNQKSFGWKSLDVLESGSQEYRDAVLYNKKVAATWYNAWVTKLAEDDTQWAAFRGEEPKKETAAAPTQGLGDVFDD